MENKVYPADAEAEAVGVAFSFRDEPTTNVERVT